MHTKIIVQPVARRFKILRNLFQCKGAQKLAVFKTIVQKRMSIDSEMLNGKLPKTPK